MTSALTVPEETTWVSDFGPIPYEALDLASKPYEVRSYWLADFRLKAIGEALGFAAKFESPEVFSAYLDIKGDEGYIYFEIKANTRPMTLSLRYSAERWSAVDGRGAHTTLKNSYSDTAVKSRGVLTVFHAFLDKELLNTVCEQLEIPQETQAKLLTRINFKEKTYSLVASEDAASDFPSQKPYKTSIIPTSPKAGESMNAQEEMAEATVTETASAEPSVTETASDANPTAAGDVTPTDIARAEIVAWATSAETEAKEEPASVESKPEAPVEAPALETSPVEASAAVEAPTPAAEAPAAETPAAETPAAEAPAAETPAAETPAAETPAAETPAAETPAAETPAAETPAAETPAAETPAAETPAAEAPTPAPAPEATVEPAATTETPSIEQPTQGSSEPAATATEAAPAAQEPEKKKAELWKTPAEIRAEKPPSQNAAKNSDPGILGKLAAKNNDDRSGNRDKKDNRENNKERDNNARSNSAQGRTNFAPQNNRSLEAPRPAESTPKYHTYSQSEVDNLIKKSAENVTNSVTSKINKQTKTVEETLKNQEFVFKQALEQINKQAEAANLKLDKAVSELTSASAKHKSESKDAFEKEIEEFKSQINKKVNQGIKVIDSKLEQISEVKKPKPAPTPKSAPASNPSINLNLLYGVLAIVVLLSLGNIIMLFNAFEKISNLENAAKTTTTANPATAGEVPIPDLMKDQVNTTAPAPVQP